jgi:Zn-dependent M28 family amino/carboxypeptidase
MFLIILFCSLAYGETIFMDELEKNLKVHVKKLALEIGERNFIKYEELEKAADYIINEFSKYGYTSELQMYKIGERTYKNIIVTLKGTKEPDKVIIVGAHYDSVIGSPGADDNASGVAGLLELARLMRKEKPDKTIKFIAFTNEEPPFFHSGQMGSRVYAREAKRRKEKIEAMICLEMIGYFRYEKNSQSYPFPLNFFYPNTGNFIAVVGNIASKELVNKVTYIFKKHSKFPIESIATFSIVPGIDFSDHASFWLYGYKAVMITDTAFYRNPNYHSHTDLPHTLNYKDLAEVVRGLYYVIMKLSDVK